MILTPTGERAIEDLTAGDFVLTRDGGPKEIRWVGFSRVSAHAIDLLPALRPILIKTGALGPDTPVRDLIVSPQHRVLIASRIAQRMFGEAEVLAAAKHLVGLEGIVVVKTGEAIDYYHLLLDTHEIITANGAPTETLYLGSEALKSIGAGARRELRALFPELIDQGATTIAARTLVKGQKARRLAERQVQNAQALIG